jgi:hypothetical protein
LALDLLPITQQFEEFRYVIHKDTLNKCFAETADFQVILAYLTFIEAQKTQTLYVKISCDLTIVEGVTSSVFFLLSMSFFSGTRNWQRETLILPSCLSYLKSRNQGGNSLSQGQQDVFRHFLFSSCSALEHFSRMMFSENSFGLSKNEAFSIVMRIIAYLEELSGTIKTTHELSTQIEQLSYFINYWQKTAAGSITSQNVANPEVKEGVFDGIWWLGRDLKDEFNQIGKQRFLEMISIMRRLIEEAGPSAYKLTQKSVIL